MASEEGRRAYALLSEGTRRWVARKGWPDLRPIQSAAISSLLDENPGTSLVISAATASGKALVDSEPVLTARGWVPIGEVGVGDFAYSLDGRTWPVTGRFPQGERDAWRVTLADGRHVDCDIEHRWLVRDGGRQAVMTTGEMLGAGLAAPDGSPHFLLPPCAAIDPRAMLAAGTVPPDMEGLRHLMGGGWVGISSIEPLGRREPMTCISVASPSHTYLTRDLVVTHNTEAAFLPALTMVQRQMEASDENFVYMLYVAPLKALINDQYRRLTEMAEPCGVPVYMWHGDAPQGQKAQLMREHCGVLMTTPESLESFLMNRGEWCARNLTPIVTVVDEFHAFLGAGRGRQLLSLLDRIDAMCASAGRGAPVRIGLSATLSQLDKVGRTLSPRRPVAIIDGTQEGKDDSFLAISTFQGCEDPEDGRNAIPPLVAMADMVIDDSGGHKTLTFAKSRKDVETMSATINDRCKARGIRSQAFPHHGSLSKETREALEHRLVSTDKPTMAVATVTLELGIDIGDIYEVFQVGAPNSVASLRQRMGRSGRRGGDRRMRCMATLSSSPEQMQPDLTTLIAEVELMEAGWFEPPASTRHDVSVLISEILSVLRQYGTAYPDELHALLCEHGGFPDVTEELFHAVLDDMEESRLVMFSADGTCLIAEEGEREIGDWHFYATFQSEESFSVKAGAKTIGEITPPSTSLARLVGGGVFMLAGRYWEVQDIDMRNKSIAVKQTRQKAEFLVPTSRGGGDVSGMVKRKRISLLVGKDSGIVPGYVDEKGLEALAEAREWAKAHRLNALGISIHDGGDQGSETPTEVKARLAKGWVDDADTVCAPPVDAATYDAICKVFEQLGMMPGGLQCLPLYRIHDMCEAALMAQDEIEGRIGTLVDDGMVKELREREKFNHYLSDATLRMAYADEVLDLRGAFRWMAAFERFWERPDRVAIR